MKRVLRALPGMLLPFLLLEAQIVAPRPGFVRFSNAPIQAVYGVSGNLMLAPAQFSSADAASFSDVAGLSASNGRLQLVGLNGKEIGGTSYQGSTPLLGSDPTPRSAVAWLPDTRTLLCWDGESFLSVPVAGFDPDDVATWLSLTDAKTARILVRHQDRTVSAVILSLATGNIRSSDYVPGAEGSVFQAGKYTIWADKNGLEFESQSGDRRALPFPAFPFVAEQMSSQWVHLYVPADGTHWALHVGNAEPTLSRLPVIPRA